MTTFLEYYKKVINENAKKKGFWDEPINLSEKLMLTVSELSEAQEADREDNYVNPIDVKQFYEDVIVEGCMNVDKKSMLEFFESNIKNTFEDEIADACIRLLDICEYKNIDIERHIQIKHWYNSLRPFKHGKKY